ncbi:MAG: hypothetical protein H3C35_04485 [Bacteroidetes bacterium]|nr:hypothetical protein [Bacteroidota bacterium]
MTHQFFTNRMHLTDEGIALFVDAIRLQKLHSLPDEISKHAAECDECGMQISEMMEILSSEPADTVQKHPWLDREEPKLKSANLIRYGIAAFLIISIGAGLFYFSLEKEKIQPTPVVHQENTIPISEHQISDKVTPEAPKTAPKQEMTKKNTLELVADNFLPSENLEDLVRVQFRSASIEVLSPLSSATVTLPIHFQWKAGDLPLTITILSNREKILASAQTKNGSFTFSKHIPPGLYYWKLQTNDELLFFDKFFVK